MSGCKRFGAARTASGGDNADSGYYRAKGTTGYLSLLSIRPEVPGGSRPAGVDRPFEVTGSSSEFPNARCRVTPYFTSSYRRPFRISRFVSVYPADKHGSQPCEDLPGGKARAMMALDDISETKTTKGRSTAGQSAGAAAERQHRPARSARYRSLGVSPRRTHLPRADTASLHRTGAAIHALNGGAARLRGGQHRPGPAAGQGLWRAPHASPLGALSAPAGLAAGYPGDWESIDYLLDGINRTPEEDFGHALEQHALWCAASQQHRNKVAYQTMLFDRLIRAEAHRQGPLDRLRRLARPRIARPPRRRFPRRDRPQRRRRLGARRVAGAPGPVRRALHPRPGFRAQRRLPGRPLRPLRPRRRRRPLRLSERRPGDQAAARGLPEVRRR